MKTNDRLLLLIKYTLSNIYGLGLLKDKKKRWKIILPALALFGTVIAIVYYTIVSGVLELELEKITSLQIIGYSVMTLLSFFPILVFISIKSLFFGRRRNDGIEKSYPISNYDYYWLEIAVTFSIIVVGSILFSIGTLLASIKLLGFSILVIIQTFSVSLTIAIVFSVCLFLIVSLVAKLSSRVTNYHIGSLLISVILVEVVAVLIILLIGTYSSVDSLMVLILPVLLLISADTPITIIIGSIVGLLFSFLLLDGAINYCYETYEIIQERRDEQKPLIHKRRNNHYSYKKKSIIASFSVTSSVNKIVNLFSNTVYFLFSVFVMDFSLEIFYEMLHFSEADMSLIMFFQLCVLIIFAGIKGTSVFSGQKGCIWIFKTIPVSVSELVNTMALKIYQGFAIFLSLLFLSLFYLVEELSLGALFELWIIMIFISYFIILVSVVFDLLFGNSDMSINFLTLILYFIFVSVYLTLLFLLLYYTKDIMLLTVVSVFTSLIGTLIIQIFLKSDKAKLAFMKL